jgi:hypothetical protein
MNRHYRRLAAKNGTLREEYEALVNRKIRLRYSLSKELSLHRQRESKKEEYEAFEAFIALCKEEAKKEIYGEEGAS